MAVRFFRGDGYWNKNRDLTGAEQLRRFSTTVIAPSARSMSRSTLDFRAIRSVSQYARGPAIRRPRVAHSLRSWSRFGVRNFH